MDRRFTWLVIAAFVGACASGRSPQPAAPAPAPQIQAESATTTKVDRIYDSNLDATLWTQRAVEHDVVFREIYQDATEKLQAALNDPEWDALPRGERKGSPRDLPPAVIMDVDETLLDNSPYQARLLHTGEEFNDYSWSRWCLEKRARALPGAVEFTKYATDHGVTVFYLTNRTQDLDTVTLENLERVGFPITEGTQFLGLGTVVAGCEQYGSDKGCRRQLVGQKYRVLMQFGDQVGDFVDITANTPEARGHDLEPYTSWFGERWWMLPNPTYGSWVPAVFNNDWMLPRSVREKAKVDALTSN